MYQKKTRTQDLELLYSYRTMNCIVCGRTPCDPHHIKTRGAGGDDTVENLLALCREHHTEVHQIGPTKFLDKYPLLKL